jgi:hypothetical protein
VVSEKGKEPPPEFELEREPEDPSRCFSCRRKVGLLGHRCRCNHTYCKVHRLPEEHTCDYDYAGVAKARIQQENPLVKYKKVGDI